MLYEMRTHQASIGGLRAQQHGHRKHGGGQRGAAGLVGVGSHHDAGAAGLLGLLGLELGPGAGSGRGETEHLSGEIAVKALPGPRLCRTRTLVHSCIFITRSASKPGRGPG